MSQYDFGNLESPLSGTTFFNTHLEPWRNALHSNHAGSSRPSYAVASMTWVNTTTNPHVLNYFDGSQDIPLGYIDISTNSFVPAGLLLNNTAATSNPTVNDDSADGYAVGSKWVNVTGDLVFECVDSSVGAAVWKQMVDTNSTQTLSGKTLTSPTINGGTISGINDLAVADGGTGASTAAQARTNLGATAIGSALFTAVDAASARSIIGYNGLNAVINGAMNIAQRGTSFTGIAHNAYGLDRWVHTKAGTVVGDVTQSNDVPSSTAFLYSLRHTVTTADASIAATDYCVITQRIEGFNASRFIGKDMVLGFWVRSAVTGTYCVSFQNDGFDRCFVREYTINAANTWEYKTVTVPSGLITAGTWNWTTGVGLRVNFVLAAGSNFQSTAGSWLASSSILATANQVNAVGTIGNIFAITGVQLEEGLTASTFEHRPFPTELALCQRYYEKTFPYATAPAQNAGSDGSLEIICAVSSQTVSTPFTYKATKRASPTIITYSTNAASANWGTNTDTPVAVVATAGNDSRAYIRANTPITAGRSYSIHVTADAEI